MSTWSVSGASGGSNIIGNVKRKRVSLATGSVTFEMVMAGLGDNYFFQYRQEITLARDGVTWFIGIVTARERIGDGRSERHAYTISDQWWILENLLFQTQIPIRNGAVQQWQTQAILGIRTDVGHYGEPLTVGQQVTAIVQYARDRGYNLALGNVAVNDAMVAVEIDRATCAQAIRTCLRYTPDVVSFWQYQPNPKLSVVRRAGLVAMSRQIDQFAESASITRRDDLIPGSVVLHYKRVSTVDGVDVVDVITDAAPAGSQGLEIGAIVDTIPIGGLHASYPKTKIRTIPIRKGGNPTADNLARTYWGTKLGLKGIAKAVDAAGTIPALTFYLLESGNYFDVALANPTGVNGSEPYEDPEANSSSAEIQRSYQRRNPNGNYNPVNAQNARRIVVDPQLPNELIEGTVAPWMSGVKVQKWIVTMKVAYVTVRGDRVGPKICTVRLTATNAENREYCQLADTVPGEVAPTGIAASMLSALSAPHYQGTVTTVPFAEVDGQLGPGVALNITGANSDWQNMGAVIQQAEEDIDKGVTTITMGPPEHLGPQDYIALLQRDRSAVNTLNRFATTREQQWGRPE